MSTRLNQERENTLQPLRMSAAIEKISKLGYNVTQINDTLLQFKYPNDFSGRDVNYFPYSGWASGATIKDGRGLKKLLKQITKSK